MGLLFGAGWIKDLSSRLDPLWVTPLASGFVENQSEHPNAIIAGAGRVLVWSNDLLLAIDPATGAIAERVKLRGARHEGFTGDGALVFAHRQQLTRLDPHTLAWSDMTPPIAASRVATDHPDDPTSDPVLVVGRRSLRARLEVRSRVTRHRLLVCDEGHPPRDHEIASYTLRTDRLELVDRGGAIVSGRVGSDPECPTASIAACDHGPVAIVRRRFREWHEHSISADGADLVGHGPVTLELIVIPEGHEPGHARDLGEIDESWEGLGRRGGAPRLVATTGARAVGVAQGVAVIELVELAPKRGEGQGLQAKRRALAGFRER